MTNCCRPNAAGLVLLKLSELLESKYLGEFLSNVDGLVGEVSEWFGGSG